MKKLLTASLLFIAAILQAQCNLLLHDDYSDASLWTPVVTTPGSVTISGGVMSYNNLIGGSYNRMYRALPSTLPDTHWEANCAFKPISGNGPAHYVMAFSAGTPDPLSYDGTAAYALTNEDAIMVYYAYPPTPTSTSCCTSPALGPWQLIARSKKGTVLATASTGIPITTLNQYVYVQLIRQSPGMLIMRAFSDNAHTTELPGSPVYYCIDPTITGLNTLHQGVLTWAGYIRQLNAQIDDLDICTGSSDTTYVQGCGNVILQAPPGATAYTWTPASAACSSCAQATVSAPAAGTDYYSVLTNAGCGSFIHYFAVQRAVGCAPAGTCPVTAGPDTSVCPGEQVQLYASSGFDTYHWLPATGLSDANIANPVATVTGTTSYTLTATQSGSGTGPNLLVNGDFALGNVGFISDLNFTSFYNPGNYYVAPTFFTTAYATTGDHTPTADGMFMSVDGAPVLERLWEETVSGLSMGTDYDFGFWTTLGSVNNAQFEIHMIGNITGDNIIGTPVEPAGAPPPASYWIWGAVNAPTWNSGPNTTVTIRIINTELNGYGNDFALDDFNFHKRTSSSCIAKDTVTIAVKSVPPPPMVQDTAYCPGIATIPVHATGSNLVWYGNPGDTTGTTIAPQPVLPSAGTSNYYVTQTVNGCTSDTAAVHVSVLDSLPVFSLDRTQPLCSQPTMLLGPQNPNWNYLWENGDTISPRTVSGTGTYMLTAFSACGSASDTVTLEFEECHCYFYVPNSFTPNGDGKNDVFLPQHDCIFETYDMMIFDRWGEKIFETTDPFKGWDGRYHGDLVEQGVYVVKFNYKGEDERGHFNGKSVVTSVCVIR